MNGWQGDGLLSVGPQQMGTINLAVASTVYLGLVAPISSIVGLLILYGLECAESFINNLCGFI